MLGFERTRRALPVMAWLIGFGLLPSACDGGGDGPGSGVPDAGNLHGGGGSDNGGRGGGEVLSDAGRFLQDYASAVCAMYEPCCNTAGQGFDATGCSDWFARVTAAYLPDAYVPDLGAQCLQQLAAARASDPDRCNTVGSFDLATLRSECERAFVAPARDGSPLGGDCLLAGECAATGTEPGSIICYSGTCVLERRGSAGDGPCYAGGGVGLQPEMYTCAADDGLYCDRRVNACAAHVGAGEYCPFANACGDSALCVGATCRALPEPGEPCLNGVPGAGGYCRAGSACDRTTLICGPALELGQPCSDTRPCASGVCLDGVCARSDWQRNLNCTG